MFLNREAISLKEAQRLLAELSVWPKTELKSARSAHGFVLAENVFAPFPIPAFRRSGYDGFGILACDNKNFPREFQVMETLGAGATLDKTLQPGECVRIMTGAKVPDDVAAVVMLEETENLSASRVRILNGSAKSNISEIGEEIKAKENVLSVGTRLNAGAISVLCAFGINEVTVYKKPRVAVVATGSELSRAATPETGTVYNSNGPLLAGLISENGGIVTGEYELTDDLDATRALFRRLTKENDLVVTTGGVSVGDFDFVARVAKEQTFLFNKLAMRPGSPTTAFVMNETPVVALSGNPSACFTGFWFFVEPLIQRFQGRETAAEEGKAILAHAYTKKNEFDRYLHGVLDACGTVTLDGHGQSSELASLYQANCFYQIPYGTSVSAGGSVKIWRLP
ncbi:MAG: molybdopterin molybdotransferase MoeA [Streptococcaceae bacterium]|nr:molybdopterin molybdotransferase MoeA [Streptococcaceae bacterium]